jgi:hypothetical protein
MATTAVSGGHRSEGTGPSHRKDWQLFEDRTFMIKDTFRIVTRGTDGKLHIRDYSKQESLLKAHTQTGVDDCSTDLGLRGLPVLRGLIGPMPDGKNVIRYESPEVFETLTKEWGASKTTRRARTQAPQEVSPN